MLPSAWILYTARNRQTSDVFKTIRADNRCICVCMCKYECKKVLRLRMFRNVQRLGKGESVLVESHDSHTRMRNQYVVTNRKPGFMTRTITLVFHLVIMFWESSNVQNVRQPCRTPQSDIERSRSSNVKVHKNVASQLAGGILAFRNIRRSPCARGVLYISKQASREIERPQGFLLPIKGERQISWPTLNYLPQGHDPMVHWRYPVHPDDAMILIEWTTIDKMH